MHWIEPLFCAEFADIASLAKYSPGAWDTCAKRNRVTENGKDKNLQTTAYDPVRSHRKWKCLTITPSLIKELLITPSLIKELLFPDNRNGTVVYT